MKKINELKYVDLVSNTIDIPKFKTTNEIKEYDGIIGQERALKTVQAAMEIPNKGFNLYVCGQVGMGKKPYVISVIKELAKKRPVPNDLCYIYNFENPNEPIAIELEAGKGREFKEDMSKVISNLKNNFLNTFSSDDYKKKRQVIVADFEKKKADILSKLDKATSSQGFKVKMATDGVYFSPIYEGKVLNEQEYNALPEDVKKQFKEKSPKVQEETKIAMKEIEELNKTCETKLSEWSKNLTAYIASNALNDLKIKYKGNLKIQNFIFNAQTDIVSCIEQFRMSTENTSNSNNPNAPKPNIKMWDRYKVNLLVNNEKLGAAPIVICSNPTYFDLFGKLEYENQMGTLRTDHTMLKPGVLHKANGGYLLVNARDLITNMTLWEAFKRVLRNEEISIDSSKDMMTSVNMISLKPESVKLNVEVVLFGNEAIYQQLSKIDVDFNRLFKMKADFNETIDKNKDTILHTVQYVSYVVRNNHLLPFKREAIIKLLDLSSKLAGDKTKLTASQADITDLIIEASFIANKQNKSQVESIDVVEAANAKKARYSKYDDAIKDMIEQGAVMISTSGNSVGQINGLTIINSGGFPFGKPVRITANTYMGKMGIVNIEREVSLSGTTHSKGVFILAAYIGEKFAQEFPLCFNASICFEQLYNGVDGDSASSTELYAILSSLSGIPIRQGIAVTGSVNQKGEIQPIGGVTDKIEGFYEVCKMQGLTGEQGVMIPHQNIKNLCLNDEVIEAVKNGMFHIYPVSTIDEGIEILTGVKAGNKLEKGFEKDSVYDKVYLKLKTYFEQTK